MYIFLSEQAAMFALQVCSVFVAHLFVHLPCLGMLNAAGRNLFVKLAKLRLLLSPFSAALSWRSLDSRWPISFCLSGRPLDGTLGPLGCARGTGLVTAMVLFVVRFLIFFVLF